MADGIRTLQRPDLGITLPVDGRDPPPLRAAPAMSPVTSYSPYLATPAGSTGTGLDQVLGWIATDPGLAGANEAGARGVG